MKKDDREIMNILEAFDLTGSAHSAARLAGCDPKTVRHWVAARDRGLPVGGSGRRPRLIDPFLDKVEEWVDRSKGHVRADVVHERLVAVGFDGDERTTRRAVAEAKTRWRAGHRRTYRPWITEPGMWCLCGTPHKTHYAAPGIMRNRDLGDVMSRAERGVSC